ncbi:MAG TPA: hypothetical protein VN229_10240, partial [Terriglobales bacterium]|nr:hypothetical protein [Terriglobales bacterium]
MGNLPPRSYSAIRLVRQKDINLVIALTDDVMEGRALLGSDFRPNGAGEGEKPPFNGDGHAADDWQQPFSVVKNAGIPFDRLLQGRTLIGDLRVGGVRIQVIKRLGAGLYPIGQLLLPIMEVANATDDLGALLVQGLEQAGKDLGHDIGLVLVVTGRETVDRGDGFVLGQAARRDLGHQCRH